MGNSFSCPQLFLEREAAAEKIRTDTLQRLAQFEATGETVVYESIEEWLAAWGNENEGQFIS